MAVVLNENLKSEVLKGHLEQVKLIIANGGNVNYCTNGDQKSLLHLAPNCEIAALLLSCGANINAIDRNGMTPIFCAVISKKLDLVKLMLTSGAKVNVRTLGRATPLHFASSSEIAKLLISHGSLVNARDSFGRSPLTAALIDGKEFSLVKTLLNAGADIKTRIGRCSNTVLHITDSVAVTRELLSRGCPVNIHNNKRFTPLHYAVKHKKKIGVIREILRNGADVNAVDWDGDNALIIASTSRVPDIEAIKLLLDYGTDIFAKPIESIHTSMMNHLLSIIFYRLKMAPIWLQYALLRNVGNCLQSNNEFSDEHCMFPMIRKYLEPFISIEDFDAQVLPYLLQFWSEIQKMKTYSIFRNLTLYDIVSKKHVCSKPLYRGFRQLEEEVLNNFPIYQEIIMPFLKDLLDRGRLFKKLKQLQIYCCNSSGNKIVLNDDCNLKIAEYLSEEYLHNLIFVFE